MSHPTDDEVKAINDRMDARNALMEQKRDEATRLMAEALALNETASGLIAEINSLLDESRADSARMEEIHVALKHELGQWTAPEPKSVPS